MHREDTCNKNTDSVIKQVHGNENSIQNGENKGKVKLIDIQNQIELSDKYTLR